MDWLVQLVDEHGVPKVLGYPVSALAVVGGIVGWLGGPVGIIVVLGLLLATSIILLAAVLATQRHERRETRMQSFALQALRQYVESLGKLNMTVAYQREEVSVARNGDAAWHTTLELKVDEGSELHFFAWWMEGESQLSQRERRRFKLNLECRGPGGGQLPKEVIWESDKAAWVWTYLAKPVAPGESVRLEFFFLWPRQLPKLGKSEVELFEWWNDRRHTKRLEYSIVLDSSHKRNQALRYTAVGLDDPDQKPDAGAWRIQGGRDEIPPGERVSLRLDPT